MQPDRQKEPRRIAVSELGYERMEPAGVVRHRRAKRGRSLRAGRVESINPEIRRKEPRMGSGERAEAGPKAVKTGLLSCALQM